ncbi:C6 finger domain protein [Sugiyamaella lignohabitans]|uniref:C6 finger domain protein n=1 Tax=Sugiyamaella lignohabitans TaxID=796027 RepID=A0A167FHU3_9ASCO|nr:C6 finger domain protein [Sugiyamaella lignohabitans]ANB15315.1 C6 finger domain protein [Sugiyamaella lignohabitans]
MRTKTGCATCRARRKKCDEGYPSCKQCIRLNLVCEGYGNKWKFCSPDESSLITKKNRKNSKAGSSAGHKSLVRYVSENSQSHEVHTQDSGTNISSICLPPSLPSETYQFSHSRIEELTGDSAEEVSHTIQDTQDVAQHLQESYPISPPLGLEPVRLQSFEMDLLKYHVNKIAVVSVVNDNALNPLRTLLIPVAMSSACVRKALCAVVAKHISFSQPEYERLALRYYSESLNSLSKEIVVKNDEIAILATAMLCTFEIFDSGVNVWLVHIRGLGALLQNYQNRMHRNYEHNSPSFNFCLNFLFVNDVIACITIPDHVPCIDLYRWNKNSLGSSSKYDYYVGKSKEVLFLLTEMALIRQKAQSDDTYNNSSSFIDDIKVLEQRLLELDFNQLTSTYPDETDGDTSSLTLLAETYRYATLVYLYKYAATSGKKIFEEGSDVEIEYALQCVRYIARIPENACCESTLVFPLFVAGCVLKDNDTWKSYIIQRFDKIDKNWKIGNCAKAIFAMNLVWQSGGSDWIPVLKNLNWQIVLT